MIPKVTDLQSQKVIVVVSRAEGVGIPSLAGATSSLTQPSEVDLSFIAIHIQSLSLPNTCHKQQN